MAGCIANAQGYAEAGEILRQSVDGPLNRRLFVLAETFRHLEMVEQAVAWLTEHEKS